MGDAPDLQSELRDLVETSRRDGLDRRPFALGPGQRPDAKPLANGMIRCSYGAFFFDMTANGLIVAHVDDWLSKYALAIDGTTNVEGKFARFSAASGPVPIADDNLILTGEVLVFLPAYRAHAAVISPPAPKDSDEVENGRKRAEMRDPNFMSETISAMPERTPVDRFKKDAIGLIDPFLHDWLKKTLPGVDQLSEDEKQAIFATSSAQTVAVLLYEFYSGSGPTERNFDESHAITQYIMSSRITDEITGKFKISLRSSDPATPLNPLTGGYQFSPDGGDILDSISKHVDAFKKFFLEDDPVLGFLGGVSYVAKPDPTGSVVDVTIIDEKNLNTYVMHSVKPVPREEPPFTLVSPEGSAISLTPATPYTTTRQTYHFTMPVP
jgi:hypothetical protein